MGRIVLVDVKDSGNRNFRKTALGDVHHAPASANTQQGQYKCWSLEIKKGEHQPEEKMKSKTSFKDSPSLTHFTC